ncbi:sugar MFS transporter [Lysobacter sp. TY2-98]|uniref:sugar MFS transporter n=1 Tax=Lysobacter sp. TY2-98 TaxID=2290922 RepID=UPI000E206BFD|nr:sugar MFS transporter [Lysobacter sp. TY2-98]AXK73347.1 sugar MFS transporter [Lysobacter sp. TY2-98]
MGSYSAASPVSTTDAPAGTVRPLVIVTLLFFMWGLLTSLNDVLIPHLKAVYTLNYTQAMLVQFCFFGAYFLVSLPAGALIRRIGYQRGAVTGLAIAASGCLLFYPAATSGYALFLVAFFVLAAGITILQVAANPYVTVLGDPRTASSRLTLTQAFNSLGTTIGPYFGGVLILSGAAALAPDQIAAMAPAQQAAYRATEASSVQGPYLGLAAALALLAVLFALVRLPRITHHDALPGAPTTSIFRHMHLVLGAIGIFLYVGAEVSIGSFLVNFLGEPQIAHMPAADAAKYVSYYWGGAMIGRFIGFAAMRYVRPGVALGFNAAMAIALVLIATLGSGTTAMIAILCVGLFNSIMFPTIFSMALHRLGDLTGRGSGVLCMAIVGGAVVPFVQGKLADTIGLQPSFFLPIACYAFILFFGLKYARLYERAH